MTRADQTLPTINDIIIEVEQNEDEVLTCKICGYKSKTRNGFGGHLFKHKINLEQYIMKFYIENKGLKRPTCVVCQKETRFKNGGQWAFKKYCLDHIKEAKAAASKKNLELGKMGFDPGWKAGLTKNDHPGILKHSKKMTGTHESYNGNLFLLEDFMSKKEYYFSKGKRFLIDFKDYFNSTTPFSIECLLCNKMFRRALNHLRLNHKCPFCEKLWGKSDKELKWLESKNIPNDQEHRQVYFKFEKRRFFVDGFDPETKTVYEFLGDIFHGNLKRFNPDVLSPYNDNQGYRKNMKELNNELNERIRLFEENEYKVEYIWESDWDEQNKNPPKNI